MLRTLLIPLILGLCLAPAQDDPPPGEQGVQDVAGLMRAVRDRKVPAAEKRGVVDALLATGPEAQRQLAVQLAKDCKDGRERFEKEREKILKEFAKKAKKVIATRMTREVQKEIDGLRALVMKHGTDPNLTKETVVKVSDPALARLEELLSVAPAEVWDYSEKLFERFAATLELHAEEVVLFGYYARATEALASTKDGERILARLRAPEDPAGVEGRFLDDLEREGHYATPMGEADRRVLRLNAELAPEVDPLEAEGNFILNLMRIRLGIGALLSDVRLHEAARGHSKDMDEHGFFSHTSPLRGKETPGQRAALAGTTASAENISRGQSEAKDAILGWWHSPGHHRNMLGLHRRVGLGRNERTWTQLFGR